MACSRRNLRVQNNVVHMVEKNRRNLDRINEPKCHDLTTNFCKCKFVFEARSQFVAQFLCFIYRVSQKLIRLGFCLISPQPSIGSSNRFSLLKTEIHICKFRIQNHFCVNLGGWYIGTVGSILDSTLSWEIRQFSACKMEPTQIVPLIKKVCVVSPHNVVRCPHPNYFHHQ